MADIVDYGSAFNQLRPAQTYARRAPALFNAAGRDPDLLRWFYGKVAEPTEVAPPEGFLFIPRCYAFDGRYLLDEDLNWIAPTITDWSVPEELKNWVIETFRQTAVAEANQGGTDWHHVLFAQCNAENYGHYLCEAAPKLANILRAGFKKVRYLLPENCSRYEAFTNAILAHLGIHAEALVIPKAGFTAHVDLLYFTPVATHDFRKSPTLLEFRDAALSLYGQKGGPARKLFVQREASDRRRISNQDEVAESLAAAGYEAINPGRMSVAEQVEVFSRAGSVVGSVGAGFTNILFAPREAEVFYVSTGLIDPFFWDLSCLCEQRFSWFFAQDVKRFNEADFIGDFALTVVELHHALNRSAV